MSTAGEPVVAAALALAGATAMAWGTALQQRATQEVPSASATMRLIWELAHRPAWWGSFLGIAAGFGLYAAALSVAALALVQPLLVTGLVLGSIFSARLAHRRVDRKLLWG